MINQAEKEEEREGEEEEEKEEVSFPLVGQRILILLH